MARRDETATIAAAAALIAEEVEEEAPAVEQETTDEVVAPQEAEEENIFEDFEVDLPEDLEDELTAPTNEEIQRELEDDEEYQLLDEEGQRLLARATKAEKQAAHYEKLRLQDARKGWITEAEKFFPLSAHALAEIKADSRRGFLRQAKAAHDAVVPYVKDIQAKAKAAIAVETEKATAKARTDAEAAWGKVPEKTDTPTEAVITQDQLARNRSRGDLASTIRTMIFPAKTEA